MDVNFYDPARHIPEQSGRVFITTGGTAGLGKLAILALVGRKPGHIYFAGRNKSAAK
ncbi:uncharacterized protein ACLA_009660 [Aspergillus clavatus NRRL 1]|uniref:Short-chain dehydrogenase n=1 Tax=Aspergillus clavatus (strain ATCC 1007 / CBS 513.65 / DSM 816 / NCTC 3887 / NRRL 1 / QM 1276 / 107) TaxID=344612 RepID=A1C9X5_ASPCL|nr:uncharacterized protein ACLA_009660 [Aspergillus clavatus NRRL 1]EAW12543.1 hypothetical protein ACLA_009660 [Aspergillus clavatus NRRL 1]